MLSLGFCEIGRRLLAYLTALAITAAVAVVLKWAGKALFDLPVTQSDLLLVKGLLQGLVVPFAGLWVAKRARTRRKEIGWLPLSDCEPRTI